MVAGLPVCIATNGQGLAVTEAAQGLACQIATNGLGLPIVVKSSGGIPIVFVGAVGPVNLLAGLTWVRGLSTTMTIAGGRVRAIRAGANPRVYKQVNGMIIGRSYQVTGNVYLGTADGNIFIRASTSSTLPSGDIQTSGPADFTVNATFVASATTMYIGMVLIASVDGMYDEITEALSMVLLP